MALELAAGDVFGGINGGVPVLCGCVYMQALKSILPYFQPYVDVSLTPLPEEALVLLEEPGFLEVGATPLANFPIHGALVLISFTTISLATTSPTAVILWARL